MSTKWTLVHKACYVDSRGRRIIDRNYGKGECIMSTKRTLVHKAYYVDPRERKPKARSGRQGSEAAAGLPV